MDATRWRPWGARSGSSESSGSSGSSASSTGRRASTAFGAGSATSVAIVSASLMASVVMADQHDPALDETLELGSFTLLPAVQGGEPVRFELPPYDRRLVGCSFSGIVSGISGTLTWSSDMQMRLYADDVLVFSIGGLPAAQEWDFVGIAGDGPYGQSEILFAKDDPFPTNVAWTIEFLHGWNSTSASAMAWSEVVVVLHAAPDCPADLDADGVVGGGDLSLLLGSWGRCPDAGCVGDLDGSGAIDGGDLAVLLASWGGCLE